MKYKTMKSIREYMRNNMREHYLADDKTAKYVKKMAKIRAKAISILIENHKKEFSSIKDNLLGRS